MGLQWQIGGDLNLGAAAIPERGPWGSGRGWDNAALECSLLLHGLGSRRDFAWKKRSERILAGGPRECATWLWINWRLAALIQQMVMVLELRGCLNHGLLLLFLRYGTPDWAKGRRKNYVLLWIF